MSNGYFVRKDDLDALSVRLHRRIHVTKNDDFESIKAKLYTLLSSDPRGRNLTKPRTWNNTILPKVIPRILFKAQTNKSMSSYSKETKDGKLTDFVRK